MTFNKNRIFVKTIGMGITIFIGVLLLYCTTIDPVYVLILVVVLARITDAIEDEVTRRLI